MRKEIYSIKLDGSYIIIHSFLTKLSGSEIKLEKETTDLEYRHKKQDYAFNNNKIYINNTYRFSSIYWNKTTFSNILKELEKI